MAVNVDEAEFRKVFDRYYPRMLAFLRSFLQSDDDAEDVAQNVFVKLWMKREVLLDREYLDIYLFRMTVNSAINFSKVRKRHVGLEDIDLPDELDPGRNSIHANGSTPFSKQYPKCRKNDVKCSSSADCTG